MDKRIISRFINGKIGLAESEQVRNWLEEPDSARKLEEMFLENWNQKGLASEDQERNRKLLNRIDKEIGKKQITPKTKEPFLDVSMLKTAAVWLFLIGVSFLAFLALSEHKTLIEKEVSSIDWIERTVLPGQKLELVLPDKSKVWVNSHSIIRFPSGFGSESRDVYLEGEAFFDVTKETARPFRVFAGGLTTEVLGTQFNVKSRKQKTDVALFEGMVKVSISEKGKEQLFLSPGQLAFYFSEDSDNLQKSTFDPLNSFLWKDGIIRFENETFKTIIGKLEDWYGVSILVKDNMNQDRTVTGTFSNDNLENMLIGLGFTLDFTYVLEKDFITIYPT